MQFIAPILTDSFIGPDVSRLERQTPKTDEFDFMNYLLGLQADVLFAEDGKVLTEALASTEGAAVPKMEGESKDGALLALFNRGNLDNSFLLRGDPEPVAEATGKLWTQEKTTETVKFDGVSRQAFDLEALRNVMEKPVGGSYSSQEGIPIDTDRTVLFHQDLQRSEEGKIFDRTMVVQKYTNPFGKRAENLQATRGTEGLRVDEFSTNATDKNIVFNAQTNKSQGSERSESQVDFGLGLQNVMSTSGSANVDTSQMAIGREPVTVPELFEKVETAVHRGGGKMVVNLNPPDLGQVAVEVATRGNEVEVKMMGQNNVARSVIEGGLGELRISLQAQDLVVTRLEVGILQEGSQSSEFDLANHQSDSLADEFLQRQDSQLQEEPQHRLDSTQAERSLNEPADLRANVGSNGSVASLGHGHIDLRI